MAAARAAISLAVLSTAPLSTALVPAATQPPLRRHARLLAAAPAGHHGLLGRYEAQLEAHPLRTQTATAAVLAAVGDVLAQRLEGARFFDARRFVALVAVNVLYVAPLLFCFYAANERLVGKPLARQGEVARTAGMLAVDQLINAPLCILGFYYAFALAQAAVAPGPFPGWAHLRRATGGEVRAKLLETCIKNWQVWVLPQLANFALVPPAWRLVCANAVALVWNVVLSITANR